MTIGLYSGSLNPEAFPDRAFKLIGLRVSGLGWDEDLTVRML